MKILALAGSLRAGSSNAALLHAAASFAPPGTEVIFYDGLGALPHFNPDLDGEGATPPPAVALLRTLVGDAAAVLVSCPEYAHGVPGSFKNALDWLVSSTALSDKPLVLLNASQTGGQYAQASLVETLTVMGARVLSTASRIAPFVRDRVETAEGVLAESETRDSLKRGMESLWLVLSESLAARGE